MGKSFITSVSIIGALALNAAVTVPLAAQSYADPGYAQQQEILSPRELDSLLAPIALYPDQLLSQVLMAATYPHDVEAAADWASRPTNASLRGDSLAFALDGWEWDASVKTLAQFPDILLMLDEEYDWTVRVGNAFLLQERDVMDSIQRLRHQARAAGNLRSNQYQRVYFDGAAVVIDMIDPQTLYVPTYDPMRAYGMWLYPDLPPAYFHRPYVVTRYVVVAPRLWGWSSWDWNNHRIRLDMPRYRSFYRGRDWNNHNGFWRHDGRRRVDVNVPRDRRGGFGRDNDRRENDRRDWRDDDGRRDNDRRDGPRANARPNNITPDNAPRANARPDNAPRANRTPPQAVPPGAAPQQDTDEQNRRRFNRAPGNGEGQGRPQFERRPDRNGERGSRQVYAGPQLTPPAPVAPIVTMPAQPAAPRLDRPQRGEGRGGERRVRERAQPDSGGNGGNEEARQPRRGSENRGGGEGRGPRGDRRERNPG